MNGYLANVNKVLLLQPFVNNRLEETHQRSKTNPTDLYYHQQSLYKVHRSQKGAGFKFHVRL